jgi:hypothetical protein
MLTTDAIGRRQKFGQLVVRATEYGMSVRARELRTFEDMLRKLVPVCHACLRSRPEILPHGVREAD